MESAADPRLLRPGVVWAVLPEEAKAQEAYWKLKEANPRDVVTFVPSPSEDELRTATPHPDVPQELKPGQGAVVVVLWGSQRESVEQVLRQHGAPEVHYDQPVRVEDQTALKVERYAEQLEEG